MPLGVRSTYTDTAAARRVITDLVSMIEPMDVPLVSLLGTRNETRFRMVNFPGVKIEWLEDTLSPDTDALGAALASTDGTTVTATTAVFQVGNVIKIDSEYLWVSAVDGVTLTVLRGFYGSTAATHLNAAPIEIVTIARLEGADSTPSHTTTLDNPYNYSQIFHREFGITGTAEVVKEYGISDRMNYDLQKILGGGNGRGGRGRAGVLLQQLNNTAYFGKRTEGNGTTIPRSMGGFDQYITTNVTNLAGVALSRKHIEDAVMTAWDGGGFPTTLICHGWAKRKITSFYEGAIRATPNLSLGGAVIDRVQTEFGDIDLVLDRNCPPDALWILDTDKCGWVKIRDQEWEIHDLAKTGDSTKKEVVGEFSFVCKNNTAHAKIHNFSLTK